MPVKKLSRSLLPCIKLNRQEAAGALWNLSFDDRNREAIAAVGGVEALVHPFYFIYLFVLMLQLFNINCLHPMWFCFCERLCRLYVCDFILSSVIIMVTCLPHSICL